MKGSNKLTPQQEEAWRLRGDSLTVKQIALRLNISEAAVYLRLEGADRKMNRQIITNKYD